MVVNLTKVVRSVSMSSVIGKRFLRTYQLRPRIVYLESAYEQGDTEIELALYRNMLRIGGVVFGGDWNRESVRCGVEQFEYMRNITIEHSV